MIIDKSKTDAVLGNEVKKHLESLGLLNMHKDNDLTYEQRAEIIEESFRTILKTIGMNMEDPNLIDTPSRVRKYWMNEAFAGLNWNHFPKIMTVPAEKREGMIPSMVVVDNLRVISLCAHHLATFMGVKPMGKDGVVFGPGCTIAYIPKDKILGLSKFQRIVDFISAAPNNQETLTKQILETVKFIMGTEDVAVYLGDISHLCMVTRGCTSPTSGTTTFAAGGVFLEDSEVRKEFLSICHRG